MSALTRRINQTFIAWQKKRSPSSKRVRLTHRNTYIFPTRYGFLLALTIILMGIGATNYQNNLIFVATFTIIALGLICIMMTYANLVGLRLSAHVAEPIFAGQSARFPVSLTSEKDHYAISLRTETGNLQTVDVLAGAEQRVEISQLCKTRGIHSIERVRCQSIFPLGFLQAWSWVFLHSECVVYPQPLEPDARFKSGHSQNEDYSDQFQAGVEEYYGLRAYQKGDLLSRVHWKSFAREKGLQTKEFVDYLHDPDAFSYHDFPGVDRETRLSYLCFLLLQAEREGKRFGLVLPNRTIEIQSGQEHLHQCLTALATFDWSLN